MRVYAMPGMQYAGYPSYQTQLPPELAKQSINYGTKPYYQMAQLVEVQKRAGATTNEGAHRAFTRL